MRRWLAFVAVVGWLCSARGAQAEPAATPSPESWAGQLAQLGAWMQASQRPPPCEARCFTLERLRLAGDAAGTMSFELTGAVLAPGKVAVPLFGPPPHVRILEVREGNAPAAVGFEGDHYFVVTDARRFVIRGQIALDGDRTLTVPGPLNALDADLAGGRIAEGAHLAGVAGATLHVDVGGAPPAAEAPVFQLARAIRIGRDVRFEYRLDLRSGKDLGIERMPLAFGEHVLDVSGAPGWHVEGSDLLLPTAGHAASITVTGTLDQVAHFTADPRSSYEFWLVESDPEHRVTFGGNAAPMDASESPLAATQPAARLFLVQRGQALDLSVRALTSAPVLAAIVRQHDRSIVLTARGDLVADDTLQYENSGVDYLAVAPAGRPIYLGTDAHAERILQDGDAASNAEVLVPLRKGGHAVRLQALGGAKVAPLFGVLDVPMPTYAVTASHAAVTVGLPAGVHPLAVLGGDHPTTTFDGEDAAAIALALLAAFVAVRSWASRALVALGLAGSWAIAPALYVMAMALLALAAAVWAVARFVPARLRVVAGGVATLGIAVVALTQTIARAPRTQEAMVGRTVLEAPTEARDEVASAPASSAAITKSAPAGKGMVTGGVVEGVTPVALELPSFVRAVHAQQELVTPERPFRPRVVYLTDLAIAPLVAAWLLALGTLAYRHRRDFARLLAAARARTASRDGAAPAAV